MDNIYPNNGSTTLDYPTDNNQNTDSTIFLKTVQLQ